MYIISLTYPAVFALSKYGSTGSEVTQIQTKLKSWGYYTGNIDGIYGSKTVAAVKSFQQKNGLTADGIAGSKTLAAMGITSSGSTSTTTLRYGSKGDLVTQVQNKLKSWGYYAGNVDGIYGSQTVEAVKSFQQKNGLTVDGIVGSNTFAALGITTTGTSSSSSSSTSNNSDLNLLSRVVYAEARGESYTGQVAIAAVVLNRVAHSSFPNTVSGVVYEHQAFTCVSDGQINLTPNETAKKAAQDAINGWDPTHGSIYYFNPSTATSKWIWSRPQVITIGKHIFCK